MCMFLQYEQYHLHSCYTADRAIPNNRLLFTYLSAHLISKFEAMAYDSSPPL
jgi:hypothetical protein